MEAGLIGARWEDRRIVLEEIFSDELVLVVFPDHPWARIGRVTLDALAGEPFILRERGSGTRMVMHQALNAGGLDPSRLRVIAEMGSTEAVRQGIKARIGVSILSSQAVAEDVSRKSLFIVSLDGIKILRPFFLARRKNRQLSPLCSAFLDHLRVMTAR
jgi:DNA-binding transcriptional LysR family regulator